MAEIVARVPRVHHPVAARCTAQKETRSSMMVRHYETDFNSARWCSRRQCRQGDNEIIGDPRTLFGGEGLDEAS